MQAKLSWSQARSLAHAGSIVRREWWLARSIFATAGDLKWMDWGVKRVALATDFTIADHNALDWTDAPPEKAHCVGIDLNGAITFSASSVTNTGSVTATLSLPEILDQDVTFALSSNVGLVSFPATVTIPQGASSVSFTVTGTGYPQPGGVTILASSTYISATGNILYLYVPPPPPPLPTKRFVVNFTNNSPPNALYRNYPVATIVNGPSPADVWITGIADDDVTFNGVIYEADVYPFFLYTVPGHRNGKHQFSYHFALEAGATFDIGTINNGGAGSLTASIDLTFSGYNGSAALKTL